MVVACAGDNLYIVSGCIPPRLATVYPWIPPEKLVVVDQCAIGMFAWQEMIHLCAGNVVNKRYAHTVPANHRKIMSAGKMPCTHHPLSIPVVGLLPPHS